MAAMAEGDLDAVVALLHPDVILTGDANGKASTAVHVIQGRTRWSGSSSAWPAATARRSIRRISWRWSTANWASTRRALGAPGPDGYWDDAPRVTAMTVRDGKVCAIWDIANPDKFTGSPLRR